MLKKKLEDDLNRMPEKKDRKIPASIFLGSVFIGSVIMFARWPLLSVLVLAADLVGFAYVLLKRS